MKKIISLILAVGLLLTFGIMGALADENVTGITAESLAGGQLVSCIVNSLTLPSGIWENEHIATLMEK